MVLAKENNVFKTVATGSGLFKCTKAYYDAHKNDIPNNTAILITDDAADGDYVTEDELQEEVAKRVFTRLATLGADTPYTLSSSDWTSQCFRKVNYFDTASSPNVQVGDGSSDAGDWNVYNFYYGDSNYSILFAFNPRKQDKIYVNYCWGGTYAGWKTISDNKSTAITPTAVSTYLTITSSNIQKTGRIVTVSVYGTLKAGTNSGAAIMTGLPVPTTGNNTSGIEVALYVGDEVRPCYLQASGSLVGWYTMTADTDVRINFTYTAKAV